MPAGSGEAHGREVAERLQKKRERIIEAWVRITRDEVPAARLQGRTALVDSLPVVLGELADALQLDHSQPEMRLREQVLGRVHGLSRALLREYDLDQVIHEYEILRRVLLDQLEDEGPISAASRRIVLDAVHTGVRNSVAEFTARREEERRAQETERQRFAAQVASDQEAWLRSVLDHLPAPLLLVEPGSARVLFANKAAAFLSEGEEDTFLTDENGRRLGPDERPEVRAARGERLEGEQVWWRSPSGAARALVIHTNVVPQVEGHPPTIIAKFQDVTQLKRSEAQVRKLAQLQQQLMGIVGHDLRNPLTAIITTAQLLLRRLDDCHKVAVERIAQSALRAVRIINDLLDLSLSSSSSGIPVQRVPSDLQQIARDVVDELSAAHPERPILLRVEGDARCACDPSRIGQVISNLLSNAMQHGAPRTPVRVAVRGEDDAVQLEVHNEGPPIPVELLPHVFEPFRRGSEEMPPGRRNAGLGLFIVREIVDRHGGTVEARSATGEGTTFTVRLPRDEVDEEAAPGAHA